MTEKTDQAIPVHPNATTTSPVGVAFSPSRWCVNLALASFVPVDGGIREVATHLVALPWPLAKAVHKALGEVLAEYERNEGEVVLPHSAIRKVQELHAANAKPAKAKTPRKG